MKHIIKDVNISTGINCMFSSIFNIMKYEKINVTEAEIFFLCNGIDILYNLDLNSIGNPDYKGMMLDFASKYSIQVHYKFDRIKGVDIKETYNSLIQDKIVILFTYSKFLNYHEILKGSENGDHVIILYGIDENKQVAYIGDSAIISDSGETLTFSGPVELAELQESIWGYTWFDFNSGNDPKKNDIFNLVLSRLNSFIHGYKVGENEYHGIAALRKYFEDLRILNEMDKIDLKNTCSNIYYCMRVSGIVNILNYTKQFVIESEYFSNLKASFLKILIEMQGEWKLIMFCIYKIGIRGNKSDIDWVMKKSLILTQKLDLAIKAICNCSF